MIPENNAVEESMEKESELGSTNQPHSPASTGSQQSKLQKLKKSLSFKTKSIRSKSAENFFQRTYSDMKIDLCSEESLISSGQIQTSESQPSTPSKAAQQVDNKTHIFQEHMFKKPTFCDVCNHMIVGANTKYGLRCKACKMSIHHRCAESTGFQHCMGKLPKGFRRYYSSPLLVNEQFGCIKEVMPIACGNKVDPVYEALRFGTSLAQKDKKSSSGSGSDSPTGNSAADLAEVPEERDSPLLMDISREHEDSVFCKGNDIENLREDHQQKTIHSTVPTSTYVPLYKDPEDIFVALYKFVPQEIEDLAMRPGDRIIVLDDSNEDWWKGQIEEKVGYFPANFVQKFQKDAELFRCCKTFIGCKEQGQITLKENQICASYEKQHTDFLNVTSGKKKGFVPLDILEKI